MKVVELQEGGYDVYDYRDDWATARLVAHAMTVESLRAAIRLLSPEYDFGFVALLGAGWD